MATKIDALRKIIKVHEAGKFGGYNEILGCEYLANEGKRCAVGALLSDAAVTQLAKSTFHHSSISSILERGDNLLAHDEIKKFGFTREEIQILQHLHDTCFHSRSNSESALKELVECMRLVVAGEAVILTYYNDHYTQQYAHQYIDFSE